MEGSHERGASEDFNDEHNELTMLFASSASLSYDGCEIFIRAAASSLTAYPAALSMICGYSRRASVFSVSVFLSVIRVFTFQVVCYAKKTFITVLVNDAGGYGFHYFAAAFFSVGTGEAEAALSLKRRELP